MSITLYVWKTPPDPIKTEIVTVEEGDLRQILPRGRATGCNKIQATCNQFASEMHHVKRGKMVKFL